jgi:hypothetical protein
VLVTVSIMVQHIQVCAFSIVHIIVLNADIIIRKIFTFVVLLNLAGLTLAIMDLWPYPRQYTDALALGNLLTAILIRNELFGRVLYLVVNKLFARVSGVLVLLHGSHVF